MDAPWAALCPNSVTLAGNLEKTKVSGLDQIDKLQDGVNDLAAGQVGQGGIAQPIGDAFSKQAINRAERQGKNDKGGYLPDQGGVLARGGDSLLGGVADGGRKAAGAAQDGLSSTSNGNLQVSLQSSP